MGDIIEKLNYDKFFMDAFPVLKKLNLNKHEIKGLDNYVYYNSENLKNINTFFKDNYKIPRIGEDYLVPINDRYNINFNQSAEIERKSYDSMYNWYENILTRELKNLI